MSEPTHLTRDQRPFLALVEQEVKRTLDRKAIPAVKDVLGDIRFLTQLDLTIVSGDQEVAGQSEVLEVRYGLTVDGGALPEEHSALWDRLTDVFYGYDDDVGTIVDLRKVRALCNGIELDGFSGYDLDGFREPTLGASVVATPSEMFEEDWQQAQQRPIPVAIAECQGHPVTSLPRAGKDDIEALVREVISEFAKIEHLDAIDPGLIEGTDTLFALMGYQDQMASGVEKTLLLQADVLGMTPSPVIVTVDCAVRVLTRLIGDHDATLDERLRPYGVFDMSAGERKQYFGCGMVSVVCQRVEPDGDGTKKTFGLEFQCDDSIIVTYRLSPDGATTLLSYTDDDGNDSIQDNCYYGEMMRDLES